jgi:iron complex transport system ATP-binding protein
MANDYFRTEKLSVGYGGETLIRDISIGVEKGEIIALIGPNGSGKSTILKSITRHLKAIAGTVFIERQDLRALSHHALATQMAVMLTERVKPELMTCWDVVAAGRYPYTGRLGILSPEDEKKVRAAMETVRAFDLSGRDFNAISDGQRQRVLLARAIAQDPDIIVLDEPTSFLDIRHKLELLGILRGMAKEKGITVILSLHEIDLAQKIADKILCVKGETISRYDVPEAIFREEEIRELYDIGEGFYDPCFGSIELSRPRGVPEVFVLSACGSGIPVFRALQKENTPFYAGILYTNDIDYRLARLLAAEVISEKPFREIGDEAYERALSALHACKRVINAGVEIGPCNRRMLDLIKEAERVSGASFILSKNLKPSGETRT